MRFSTFYILPFLIFVFIYSAIFSQNPKNRTIIKPTVIDEVLTNPGIGFMTFQRFNGDSHNEWFKRTGNWFALRIFSCGSEVQHGKLKVTSWWENNCFTTYCKDFVLISRSVEVNNKLVFVCPDINLNKSAIEDKTQEVCYQLNEIKEIIEKLGNGKGVEV